MPTSKSSDALRRDFGRWISQQREARRITQKSLAAKSRLTVTQLSRIENGHSGTKRDTVILLAQLIGVNEAEALRQFAPESFQHIPEELENIPFYEFDKFELKEIADFINFKLAQKRAAQTGKAIKIQEKPTPIKLKKDKKAIREKKEAEKPDLPLDFETLPPADSRHPSPYRVEDGKLTSDEKTEKNKHTKKKPPE